ncbi:hypothetical protein IQ269_17405 [Tychonema sp. LEGE 07199]|uniref:hypothetical protein n=1 Tax=unclassified Tychonema TaxID=2642144 RepID=UPI001882B8A8|nr:MULTISPECIES: hypothetical protein [unclassified Tychonema]MBE9122527.1 hypothetical protein [Tychonema sp. LEGE 07199]MBE9134525.1 hypothetical protein [Tychonema sp. LEGE 07196]
MSTPELMTESLTEEQWKIAHEIAQNLAKDNTDVNEFKKAIAYLRNAVNQNKADATSRFFKYLKILVGNGRQIGHSGKTTGYYRSIDKACSDCLKGFQGDASTLLQILGWASRLMRYYKEAGPIGEVSVPVLESARQVEIAKAMGSHEFAVGQIVEAKVTAVKGNKVTYEILGTIRLTEKEPKKAQSFSEEQVVKVEILDIKEDGSPKKVKCAG